ncbi:MAG: NAD(P)H-dependent oxidoreductase [Clostridium sp.]
MNSLIIYAHPNKNSFTKVIADRLRETLEGSGHSVNFRDLYEIEFNPVLTQEDYERLEKGDTPCDILVEQEFIKEADNIIFVFPTWWESMPAIMRGYIDRVFSYGFAYGSDENGAIGLLNGKTASIIQLAGASSEEFDKLGIKKAIEVSHNIGIFEFCGLKPLGHFIFNSVPFVSHEERQDMINQVVEFGKSI